MILLEIAALTFGSVLRASSAGASPEGAFAPRLAPSVVPSARPRPSPTAGRTTALQPPAAPRGIAATARPAPDSGRDRTYYEYIVAAGETLAVIAARYGVSVNAIRWSNLDLHVDYDIPAPGTRLLIPAREGVLHAVAAGDTLATVAQAYGVSPQAILDFPGNGLAPGSTLPVGFLLLVPGGRPAPVAPGVNRRAAALAALGFIPQTVDRAPAFDSAVPRGWPVTSRRITSPFDARHPLGIDIAANLGSPVFAAASGRVGFAGGDPCCSYGYFVDIDHGDGLRTRYAHLDQFFVSAGEWVQRGEVIGFVGNNGRSTGPHLHFEVRLGGVPIDPLAFLESAALAPLVDRVFGATRPELESPRIEGKPPRSAPSPEEAALPTGVTGGATSAEGAPPAVPGGGSRVPPQPPVESGRRPTPAVTASASATPSPAASAPGRTPVAARTATPIAGATPSSTARTSPTAVASATPSRTPTPGPTATATPTPAATPTLAATPPATSTPAATPTPSLTPGSAPAATPTPAVTPTPTASPTPAPARPPAATPEATPPAVATPPSPAPECQPVPRALLVLLDEPEGPRSDITGGAGECLYSVTNANDSGPGSLRAGAEAGKRWIVFDGDYTINLTSDLYVGGKVTIDGRGRHVTVTGHALRFKGPAASNVIVADLILTHAVAVSGGATDLWFDRVTMPDGADEHEQIHITNPNPAALASRRSRRRFDLLT